MSLYVDNSKDSTKKNLFFLILLELINELGKATGYKVNK